MTEKRKKVGNPALTGEGLMVEEGDNRKYLNLSMRLYKLPQVDMGNADAVRDRINEYFRLYAEADVKPTVSGLSMALGVDRRRLWEIVNDATDRHGLRNLSPTVTDLIKKAYHILEGLWEDYMQNGKINPVSGIFLGKNHFGYQDKQDVVIRADNREDGYNSEDIAKRYLLPQQDDETDSDS